VTAKGERRTIALMSSQPTKAQIQETVDRVTAALVNDGFKEGTTQGWKDDETGIYTVIKSFRASSVSKDIYVRIEVAPIPAHAQVK